MIILTSLASILYCHAPNVFSAASQNYQSMYNSSFISYHNEVLHFDCILFRSILLTS